ncbi:hypothetical protein SELMODRAFT_408343 [Selaginella moellendorffii]|uniref:Uncharacterized protein WAX2C-2 n=1 Tax=Selaginella moellendorffii TaxID=88036 RepID=D8R7Z8_SELML|nr:protein ECERIFERUM 3 [Selaginella moellendorffii]EFJ31967.1 hypothetical protein SELMODRAFT_408343 [Selaginella moellendorffii]|eukprot:XP_002967368.1 protein ECERIFERUM 3 [Selaginella moellendorffii]
MAAATTAPLSSWPWTFLGNYKYWISVPFAARALYANFYNAAYKDTDNWCLHIFVLCLIRYQTFFYASLFQHLHGVVKKHRVSAFKITFEQLDREFHWDNFIILQGLIALAAHSWVPGFSNLPVWNYRGWLYVVIFHALVTEPLYYWIHRAFHDGHLFKNYHSLHHASVNPEVATTGNSTFLEHLVQTGLIALPLLGAAVMGAASISMFYFYILSYDVLKMYGHFNCEIFPESLFRAFPLLKLVVYTPSYHSLHHSSLNSNFCLFMPVYDYLGGTMHPKTEALYTALRKGRKEEVPQFIFLAHIIDFMSTMHTSFIFRSLAAEPFGPRWFLWPPLILTVPPMFAMWAWGRTMVYSEYLVGRVHAQVRVIPRYGFHFFLPFGKKSINGFIEEAILEADRSGVKVLSLAALNKNEELNGGGVLFWKKYTNLRVKIVHGNTLTAAVVINELRPDAKEVFLTGSTSKIGRALALYLCRRGVRVLMLTNSRERYEAVVKDAPVEFQKNLVQVTKYQAGQNCKTWIVGKWIFAKDQSWAPPGTFFHQFVVPPVAEIRKDVTYGKLSGMYLPKNHEGLHFCEFTMPRGVVHACHAGGLLHALEGWDHHEIGSIDIENIDKVWQAALRQGFAPYV